MLDEPGTVVPAGIPGDSSRLVHAIMLQLITRVPNASDGQIATAADRVTERARRRAAMAVVARLSVEQVGQLRALREAGEEANAESLVAALIPEVGDLLQRAVDIEIEGEVNWLTRSDDPE